MKRLFVSSLALILVACGAMEAPDEETAGEVPGARTFESTGESLPDEVLEDALPDEVLETESVHCGTACPAGAHPSFYFCNGSCSGSPCTSVQNAVSCDTDTDTFPKCGLGCPPGWYPQWYEARGDSCNINKFLNSTDPNATSCARIQGPSLTTCGLTCPTGYRPTGRMPQLSCNQRPSSGIADNATLCERLASSVSVSVSPTRISGGRTATVRITLNDEAPDGGVEVTMSSTDAMLFPVPRTVTVPGGAATWELSVTAGNPSRVQPVSITARLDGASESAALTIEPARPVSALALASTSVTGGSTVQATVTLASAAPAGGTVVTLSSSDRSVARPALSSVRVPHRATTASFDVWTSPAASTRTATISARTISGPLGSTTLTVLGNPSPDPGSDAIHQAPGCQANTLPRNDDGSTGAVPLPFPVNFFGTTYDHLFVNNNGNVTFEAPLGTFTPFQLNANTPPIIAPFFADVDTRGSGSNEVRYSFGTVEFGGRPAFCVEWINVGYFNSHADKLNSLQLLLVDRSDQGDRDFDIVMNYGRIQWETGDASRSWRLLSLSA